MLESFVARLYAKYGRRKVIGVAALAIIWLGIGLVEDLLQPSEDSAPIVAAASVGPSAPTARSVEDMACATHGGPAPNNAYRDASGNAEKFHVSCSDGTSETQESLDGEQEAVDLFGVTSLWYQDSSLFSNCTPATVALVGSDGCHR